MTRTDLQSKNINRFTIHKYLLALPLPVAVHQVKELIRVYWYPVDPNHGRDADLHHWHDIFLHMHVLHAVAAPLLRLQPNVVGAELLQRE